MTRLAQTRQFVSELVSTWQPNWSVSSLPCQWFWVRLSSWHL